jgi:hypothetical protein
MMTAPRPGFVIGELRSDGLVHPERSVPLPNENQGGRATCKALLPIMPNTPLLLLIQSQW